jgi:hypothetical protein
MKQISFFEKKIHKNYFKIDFLGVGGHILMKEISKRYNTFLFALSYLTITITVQNKESGSY